MALSMRRSSSTPRNTVAGVASPPQCDSIPAVKFLVERNHLTFCPACLQRGVGHVAHNGQQPSAAVLTVEALERSEGPQACILNDVLGILIVVGNPAR